MTKLLSILLLAFLFLWTPVSNASEGEVFDACKSAIMQAGASDLNHLRPNAIVEKCQNFPLSEDVFVQVLGALVGPDFLIIMDAYKALTRREHGFEDNSPLFLVASPMHDVLEAMNTFLFGVFLFLLVFSLFGQMQRWQKGHFNLGIKEWASKQGMNNAIAALFTMPIFGWMTILQALALMVILLLGYVAKLVVTYLFLAAFFGNVGAEVKREVADDIQNSFGQAVLLFQCDIQRRESLISEVQSQLQTREKGALESDPIYQCLTSSSGPGGKLELVEEGASLIYDYTPAVIEQTKHCVNSNKATLNSWGYEFTGFCGSIEFEMPNNTAAPASVQNAVNLYASTNVLNAQRTLALQFNEYLCRTDSGFKTQEGVNVDSCLLAEIKGDGYSYAYTTNEFTEVEEIDYYKTIMTDTSRVLFTNEVKRGIAQVSDGIASDFSSLLQHLQDLTAPVDNEGDLPLTTQKILASIRDKLFEAETTGTIGFSEADAEFLVNNIKRGPWLSSSLFFGSLTEGLEEEKLVDYIGSVYDIDFNYSEFIETRSLMKVGAAMSLFDELGKANEEAGYGSDISVIVPRVGLYVDNLNCWYNQMDCETPPLNPFSYLGEKGAILVDTAMMNYASLVMLKQTVRSVFDWDRKKINGFLLLSTIEEFQFLYFVLGLILVIVIPLIPMMTLLVMLINWAYDIIRELIGLQIKVAMSPLAEHGQGVVSDDVKESLVRLFGLGLYFLFITIGLVVTFMCFSFLFAMNVFFVSALSSVVNWGSDLSGLDGMVVNIIFDCIVVVLLVYEVNKVTPYMEKFPKEMADYFGVKMSPTNSMSEQMLRMMRNHVAPGVSNFLHKLGK